MTHVARVVFMAGFIASSAHAAELIDLRRLEPVQAHPEAVKERAGQLCSSCHGAEGVSVVPMFPSLAGQRVEYLYHQLLRFKSGVLTDSPMTPLVASSSDQELRDYAAHYAAMAPTAAAAEITDRKAFDRGGELFLHGDSAKGIPPCQGCHGSSGQGVDATGNPTRLAYPMLRHQHADYLTSRLSAYRSGKLAQTSNDEVMRTVAHRLDDGDIAALAAWIASAP